MNLTTIRYTNKAPTSAHFQLCDGEWWI